MNIRRFATAFATLFACAPVGAGTPDDYGYRWPLVLAEAAPAHRVVLGEDVYRHLHDPALRDLEAFDAGGRALPFGPMPRVEPSARIEIEEQVARLPMFVLPAAPQAGEEHLSLHLTRDADGRLRSLHAETRPDGPAHASHGWVFDATSLETPVEALTFDWPEPAGAGFSVRVQLQASADLERWRIVLAEARLVDLGQGGLRLQRRTLELRDPVREPYLRLELLDEGATLALAAVDARMRARSEVRPARAQAAADYRGTGPDRPQHFDYASPGPLPIERVSVALVEINSVSRIGVHSRDADDQPWQWHGTVNAFHLQAGVESIDNEPLAIPATRHRQWRLTAEPPLASPPRLRFDYRPDEFVLFAQGPAQYALSGGSATARRAEYPIDSVLASIRSGQGAGWSPPKASLGALETGRGAEALVPPPPPKPVKSWLLWGVLTLGVVTILTLVVRLLRAPKAD